MFRVDDVVLDNDFLFLGAQRLLIWFDDKKLVASEVNTNSQCKQTQSYDAKLLFSSFRLVTPSLKNTKYAFVTNGLLQLPHAIRENRRQRRMNKTSSNQASAS